MKFMKVFFIFFMRLFICFVAAKFLLRALDLDSRAYLIGLTAIFLGNIYWFDFLEYRDRIAFRLRKKEKSRPEPAATPEEVSSSQIPTDN
jgi:hypothetical protein